MLASHTSSDSSILQRVGVLLPLPLGGVYDYGVHSPLVVAPGDFVRVPLGQRSVIGVVWGAAVGDVDPAKLKAVLERLEAPSMPDVVRRFVDWVAAYSLAPPGAVLKMAMSVPAALEAPTPVVGYGLAAGQVAESIDMRMTPARRRVLAVLADGPPRPAVELAREAAAGPAVVRGLFDAGLLEKIALRPRASAAAVADWRLPGPVLSADQKTAADALIGTVSDGQFSVVLLDGVPGSGKTEVYFEAVARALEAGRQVLVLLPEISLGAQWLARFKARFGAAPHQWHSDLGAAERRRTWRAIATGEARVVVGARSALFLPFAELGLIVVDEEHDAAFKQEEGVIYNARDMAVVRAQLGGAPVVLVSATPSLETVVNARSGRYAALHLPARHGSASMPVIELVDMRIDPLPAGRWLSPRLVSALEETLAEGGQAMLFLNRRGYAPLTLCRACGHRLQCPRCTAWLVEHRRGARLQCHHCGYGAVMPEACPGCEVEGKLAACGPGVERLAEEVAALLPTARQAIAASDTLTGPLAAETLVRRIETHDVDLIIGTQIVAKGYHFPLLTLVGVIDADLGLNGGDLRAVERTYQLLYQVAGRAGRADRLGRVLLQTYMPDHPVMAAMASGDRDRFLAAEIAAREAGRMPPYGRLVALIVSGVDAAAVGEAARSLGRNAPRAEGIQVWGPAPAPMALLRGRHRHRLLLVAPRNRSVQPLVRQWIATANIPAKVRVQIDVDPYGFL